MTEMSPIPAALLPGRGADAHIDSSASARGRVSLFAVSVAILCLAASAFLISPPVGGKEYPGVIPWREGSWLKLLTESISIGSTIRGVEIKDLVFYLGAAAMLLLFGVRAMVSALTPPQRRTAKGAWFLAQACLAGWVVLSAASAIWSPDAWSSLGQAAIYGFGVGWAISLAWCLEGKDVGRVLWGYVVVAATAGAICVWYYYGRNPYNRPGFPIGNPSPLAAFMLPAMCLSGFSALGAVCEATRGDRRAWIRVGLAAATLVPTVWCFALADSRGAQFGLIAGLAGLAFLLSTQRLRRWLVVGGLFAAAAGIGYFSTRTQDLALARGATIRFRVYAWQYAATLWSHRPISGLGAGSYPQMSGRLEAYMRDRALDPAAFMSEAVEHAHNELFEVFVEIGLIGGLTFVAGHLATLVAASALLQASLSARRRWLMIGLVTGLIGMMADALLGVGLRLPGLSPAFYLLIGALWAACRSVSKRREPPGAAERLPRPMTARRYIVATTAVVAAGVGLYLAWTNWLGVLDEMRADRALPAKDYEAGEAAALRAESRLLDPVRKLMAAQQRVILLSEWAGAAFNRIDKAQVVTSQAAGAPDVVRQLEETRARCRAAYDAAVALNGRAPSFGRPLGLAAHTAQLLAAIASLSDRQESLEWIARAVQCLRGQRMQRPSDVKTLLSLANLSQMGFTISAGDRVALLRDALRAGTPPPEWYGILQHEAAQPDFRAALAAMLTAVQPYGKATELDALIYSYAPEIHRLAAALAALEGQFEDAERLAARAVEMVAATALRFPDLPAAALSEQAEYAFRASPLEPQRALELAEQAIRAVPAIQIQKRMEARRPYAWRLAGYLLVAGDRDRAGTSLIDVGVPIGEIDAALEAVSDDLCRREPRVCAKLGRSPTTAPR
ncbi:MAG: O-antigen ligase family protein [Planctomycetes bacterium]|nr:O-antigen ligase family protein [Planctomycetota bacterium]